MEILSRPTKPGKRHYRQSNGRVRPIHSIGDFNIPIDGLPFNWNLETVPGAEIQIVPSVDGGEQPSTACRVFRCARFLRKREAIDTAGEWQLHF